MKRLVLIGTLLFVAACGSSPSNPSSNPSAPTLTATLLPANENPPIGNAESTGTGSVTVILNLTRDANQNITAATANFQVSLAGFPASTPVIAAHIHEGADTCNCPVRVNLALASGEVVLANGSTQFTKNNVGITDLSIAQALLNNPGGFYFNVHSSMNPGGFARGKLVRVQ